MSYRGGLIVDNGNKGILVVTYRNGVKSMVTMVEVPEQDCRSVGDDTIWITSGKQLYVLYGRAKVDVELPGVEFNGSITGVGVRFPGVIVWVVFLAILALLVNGELT